MSEPDDSILPRVGEPCPESIEELADLYVLGRLSPHAADPFELHLIGCPSCQQVVEEAELFIWATRNAAKRFEEGNLD